MKINRNNYEIFFLDYHEGNLSEDMKKELFSFLDKNADLKNEFENFEMVELPPSTIFYADKKSLKREFNTKENYQQYLIAKLEGDITKDEQNELNKYLFQHPEFQKEEKLFALTKLVPDVSVVFPEKSKLKRAIPIYAGNRKAFYFSIAAAACILLLLGVYFLRTNTNEVMQANNGTEKEITPVVKNNEVTSNENKVEKENIHNGSPKKSFASEKEKNNPVNEKTAAVEKSLAENNSVYANNLNKEKREKRKGHKKNNEERLVEENKSKGIYEIIDPIERKGIAQIEMNENTEQQIAYVNINLLKQEIGIEAALNSYLDRVIDPDANNISGSNSVADTNTFIPGDKLEKNPLLDSFAWGLSLFSNKDVTLKKSFNEEGKLVAYQFESGKFKIGRSSSR
ncbi:MAG: hypothetical protein ABIT08_17445 [Bacteroidia bacterium]